MGIFADPADVVTYHECIKDADGDFEHNVETCEDEKMFCPPVGGCGHAAGCPVTCDEGEEAIRELKCW